MSRLLALDTSSGSTGVAAWDGDRTVASRRLTRAYRHSESLFGLVDEVLAEARMDKTDLTGLAVTVGPGAFTGLRVGVATAKGIAVGLGLSVAGVSSLRALSRNAVGFEGLAVPMFDARKGQVYGAAYDVATGQELLGEGAWGPGELAAEVARVLEGTGKAACLLGSGAGSYESVFRDVLAGSMTLLPEQAWLVDPEQVARLGAQAFAEGRALYPALLAPVYHRLSEAEENKKKGRLSKGL